MDHSTVMKLSPSHRHRMVHFLFAWSREADIGIIYLLNRSYKDIDTPPVL